MSSADILAFPHSEPFPPAQVLDLAVQPLVLVQRSLPEALVELALGLLVQLGMGTIVAAQRLEALTDHVDPARLIAARKAGEGAALGQRRLLDLHRGRVADRRVLHGEVAEARGREPARPGRPLGMAVQRGLPR